MSINIYLLIFAVAALQRLRRLFSEVN